MLNPTIPVYLITARNTTLRYLGDPLNRRMLRQRLAVEGVYPAYAQAVAAACPDLAASYYVDVVDMVRRALRAKSGRRVTA